MHTDYYDKSNGQLYNLKGIFYNNVEFYFLGITDLSYAMIKETYNPCVVLDLNFNLPKSAKSSKETETFKNKNDTDNPTVKKLFNLRSSAKKPDTVRKSKLKNSVKKSNNTSRLRKRLADEDYECNSDKSSNASDEDSSSDFEDTKKKNVKSSKKTSPKIESDDEREPQKNVSSKLISPDISDNVEVSVGIDQDPPGMIFFRAVKLLLK